MNTDKAKMYYTEWYKNKYKCEPNDQDGFLDDEMIEFAESYHRKQLQELRDSLPSVSNGMSSNSRLTNVPLQKSSITYREEITQLINKMIEE